MKIKLLEELFLKSAWAVLFCLGSLAFYEYEMRSLNTESEELDRTLALLQEEIRKAQAEQELLALKIGSQSDPAWVELSLMKELGLVPEGTRKVLFYKP